MVNKMSLVKVDTYRGLKKIDVELGVIENNDGEMVKFSKVERQDIGGQMYFLYVTGEGTAVALTQAGHRKAHEISEEQKQENLNQLLVDNIMSEGFGDY